MLGKFFQLIRAHMPSQIFTDDLYYCRYRYIKMASTSIDETSTEAISGDAEDTTVQIDVVPAAVKKGMFVFTFN